MRGSASRNGIFTTPASGQRSARFTRLACVLVALLLGLAISYDSAYSSTPGKPIALTFDDGSHEYCTTQILDALDRIDGKATFFITGYRLESENNADILRRMAAAGHQIGNHRYTHKVHSPQMSDEDFKEELIKTNEAIRKVTGTTPTDFRFPWGDATLGKKKIVRELGMTTCGWNSSINDGGDYSTPSEEKTTIYLNRILKQARPHSVMLLHDAQNTHNSAAALGIALDQLTQQGYIFVTLDELQALRR